MNQPRNKNSKIKLHGFDVVIFDIDNVLVDTRFSYTDCIRETVQTYLEKYLGWTPNKTPLLSPSDVDTFKLLGGFNDDWDTCYGLILYLLSIKTRQKSIKQLKKAIDLKTFSKKITPPVFVRGIETRLGKHPKVKLAKIARLFQTLYWSKYIRRESLIVDKNIFKKMATAGILIGIATGRSKREAAYVFRRFGISKYIRKKICVDTLPHPTFKKPHPYSLLEIAKTFGRKKRYLYIGDLPDDMRMAKEAAKRVNVTAWGFSYSSTAPQKLRRALKKAGAKKIVKNVREFNSLLKSLAN